MKANSVDGKSPALSAVNLTDTFIHIDRAVSPPYPDWFKSLVHPELENTGPTKYDFATVGMWLHDNQKNGMVAGGQIIYNYLKSNKMLSLCFGLADGIEIQKRGVVILRRFIGSNAGFLWRSVIQDISNNLFVPYIYANGPAVEIRWIWLGNHWFDTSCPALFFES